MLPADANPRRMKSMKKADDRCEHTWRFLMPGFQMCTSCGAIRRKPANGTEDSAARRPAFPYEETLP